MSLGNEIRKKIKELTGYRNLNNVFLDKYSKKRKEKQAQYEKEIDHGDFLCCFWLVAQIRKKSQMKMQ